MSIEIYSNGHVKLNGQDTGLGVTQRQSGTVVYWREQAGRNYSEIQMPRPRYSLAHDAPASGNPGRQQFEADLIEVLSGARR